MKIHSIGSAIRRTAEFCRTSCGKAIAAIKEHHFVTKAVTACLIGSLAVGYTVFSSGFTIGFRVKYAGNIIATVKSTDVFEKAKQIVLKKTEGRADSEVLSSPLFHPTLTAPAQFDTADTVADAILENTEEIVEAFSLSVEGQVLLVTADENLEERLETARTRYEIDGAKNTSVFLKTTEVAAGYYLKSELAESSQVQAVIDSLDVKTVAVSQTETQVPFSRKTVRTSSQYVGYSKTTTKGVNGLSRQTETVTYQNGKEIGRNTTKEELKAPVTEIITVGVALPKTTAQQRAVVQQAGFAFPLGNADYKISAYFGDGRNHKGIDLCAKAGTPIYAVASGTVVSSKYDGNYGNCVVVDHGNGIMTRYAHASVLCVSAGTKVAQGDLLALVGTTGQSTGNHLHFEVVINGNRVNPAPYIGL